MEVLYHFFWPYLGVYTVPVHSPYIGLIYIYIYGIEQMTILKSWLYGGFHECRYLNMDGLYWKILLKG